MLRLVIAASILLWPATSFAEQEPIAHEREKDPYSSLADSATAAPPELAADILIRLAESPQAGDKAAKTEWLENAFRLAEAAKFRFKRGVAEAATKDHYLDDRVTPGYGFAETDVSATIDALADGYDTLSLQSGAANAMMAIDHERAVALFRSVHPLQVPALSCSDAAGYSVLSYYAMVQTIFAQGFNAKERQDQKDVDLLEMVISHISSPFRTCAVCRFSSAARARSDGKSALGRRLRAR